jgi:aminoglycoside 6'-N-acetyltransferase I
VLAIRPFDWRRDREAVLSFQREIYETNFPGLAVTPQFLEDYGRALKAALNDEHEGLFVLADEEGACGFLWVALVGSLVDPWSGYVKNIFVVARYRGQGWGRALLTRADEWLRARGVSRVELDCSVVNEEARRLYERSGYRATRVRMEKELT